LRSPTFTRARPVVPPPPTFMHAPLTSFPRRRWPRPPADRAVAHGRPVAPLLARCPARSRHRAAAALANVSGHVRPLTVPPPRGSARSRRRSRERQWARPPVDRAAAAWVCPVAPPLGRFPQTPRCADARPLLATSVAASARATA
jgi:hypothetical protein